MTDREREVLVGAQIALLGAVSSNRRAVEVAFGPESSHFDAYYDGKPSDADVESMSCVDTELMAMFPGNHEVTHRVMHVDFPERLPKTRRSVFLRKETA